MKLISRIAYFAKVFLPVCCLASCNYLDVVPLEKEDIKDVMKNEDAVLSFVYSCYSELQWGHTDGIDYRTYETSSDEFVLPQLWERSGQITAWNQLTSLYVPNWGVNHSWNVLYDAIGRCNQFLELIEELKPNISEEKKARFIAEVQCVKAYYYTRLMERFGPVSIVDAYPPMDTPKDKYPGRSHYDFCVDYVVKMLDDIVDSGALPATVSTDDLGRATSTICKALKARVLLTAASPLWNGSFPYRDWRNTKYETPGYGKELVSHDYSVKKWERALIACEDALNFALGDGKRALFTLEQSEIVRNNEEVPLPVVPNVDEKTPKGQEFLKRVALMSYAITAIETQGNTERLWGASFQEENLTAMLPHNIVLANNSWISGYSGISPTLNTVENFYTMNGELPDYDPTFPSKTERLKSAGLSNADIIKLNVNREPRFYAWIAFDGGEYRSVISGGNRLFIDFKDSEKQGYNPDRFNRDNCVTGFMNKKYTFPSYRFRSGDGGHNYWDKRYPYSIIRLPELYLNAAECYAYLAEKEGRKEYVQKALDRLNDIRVRAGIRRLTTDDVKGDMTLLKWVESERFIELWGEGRRYYDARRWMTAPKYFKAGVREGLNAIQKMNPSFNEFNQRIKIDQPFQWTNRMYIMPILASEVYSNPQLVQAPEY